MAAARKRGTAFPKPVAVLSPPKRIKRRKPIAFRSAKAKLRRVEWIGLRERVFQRDSRTCLVCGATRAWGLTAHHVVFRSQLGPDAEWNLATVCAGPGLSGCHVRLCHGAASRTYRTILQEKLAKMYPERYRRLLDGTLSML